MTKDNFLILVFFNSEVLNSNNILLLREEAGGGDILNVEKILKKEAKDAQRTSAQRARRERERDNSAKSLFDFINVKLGEPFIDFSSVYFSDFDIIIKIYSHTKI